MHRAHDSDDSSSDEEEDLSDSGDDSGIEGKVSKTKKTKGSDSDSDSDDDSDDDSDAAEKGEADAPKKSRFLKGDDSDDSDSDDERTKVVKSAKSKRIEEVEGSVKAIDNAAKINDWSAISNEFDKLVRLVTRQANVAEAVPTAFIKLLSTLDDMLAGAQGAKKKMNATNSKALNSMKQKVKKTQRDYEAAVAKYKEDPEAFEKAALAVDAPAPAPKKAKKAAGAAGAEEEDDSFQTVGVKGKTITISSEGIYKALAQVLEARGRKNTDRSEQTKILEKLLSVATNTYQRIRVLLALISALLDYNPSMNTHMPLESWTAARANLDALLDELTAQREYVVREEAPDYDDQVERAPTPAEPLIIVRGSVISLVDRLDDEFTKSLQNIDPHTSEYIDRLRDEKLIYETVVKAQIYFEQVQLAEHLDRVVMRRLEHIYCKPDVVIQSLESHLPSLAVQSKIWPAGSASSSSPDSTALVRALCVHLYKTDASLLRTRAMLSHIYHYALHDNYYTARDMLLMSHLQDTVGGADVGTQILYNRTVVQVGLCAFRLGLIRESQSTLQEIFATQRVKELLAQGVQAQRYSALTPEQDKLERQRQLPFHMHINLELLECAYLVSSMLLEVPLMAQAGNDPELKKRVISRTFRRQLDYANRQVFTGPPENKRDHVMQATKALQAGDWQQCVELVHSIKVWNLMPSEKAVKDMLQKKIQEEGLRTYLFTYAPFYSTLSLAHLASTFDLPLSTATSLVSKMIWNEELAASLDQVAGVVVLQTTELSQLQRMALALAEKASTLADTSERYLDSKVSSGEQRSDGVRTERTERGEGGRERRGGGRGRDYICVVATKWGNFGLPQRKTDRECLASGLLVWMLVFPLVTNATMLSFTQPALTGWHKGEKLVQRKLHFEDAVADQYEYISHNLPQQHRLFHSTRLSFLPFATRSAEDGRVWCSILCPSPDQPPHVVGSFISSPTPTSLVILADVWPGDPIRSTLIDGGLVAGVGVELETRRRNKFAGKVLMSAWNESKSRLGMEVSVTEAIGNCPKYITVDHLAPCHSSPVVTYDYPSVSPTGQVLSQDLIDHINSSPAVYLATSSGPATAGNPNPHLGCNHRGGPPGFSRVLPSSQGRTVVIPDFSGNRMMSSLGNIELDPKVGLAFPDFFTGNILYITGDAKNLFDGDAAKVMERCKLVTVVEITGFVFVKNALTARHVAGTEREESPYSPRVRFLIEERQAEGFMSADGGSAEVDARLVKAEKITDDIGRFEFALSREMSWKAGQYVILDCLDMLGGSVDYQHMTSEGNEKSVNEDGVRTWTISSAPSTDRLTITLRLVPRGTITPRLFRHLSSATALPPLTLRLLGIGGSFLLPPTPRKLLLIAGGIGLTPSLAFLGALAKRPADEGGWEVELMVSTKEPGVIVRLVQDALGAGDRPVNLRLRLFSSTTKILVASNGNFEVALENSRISKEVIFKSAKNFAPESVYLCGPEAFEKAVMEGLEAAGVKGDLVVREKFTY
ncbi:translation initiation factor 3 subunit C, partial [Phenoliferia sp. Uapishka_3]